MIMIDAWTYLKTEIFTNRSQFELRGVNMTISDVLETNSGKTKRLTVRIQAGHIFDIHWDQHQR